MIDAPDGKPYAFVPLNVSDRTEVATAPPHDRFAPGEAYTGYLQLRLKALGPVTVLSGELAGSEAHGIYAAMTHQADRPCLPGSSVKGVVRSIAEACAPSCAPQLPGGHPACARIQGTSRSACPVCRVFGYSQGHQSYRGRVRMDDFLLQSQELRVPPSGADSATVILGIPALHQPHREVYREGGEARGRKFYFHGSAPEVGPLRVQAVPAGGTFVGRVYLDNLSRQEAGMLFFALGLDHSIDWKLGYGKPAYLGSVRPVLTEFHFMTERYGTRVGAAVDPCELASAYAATGLGWAGVTEAIASLRQILSPTVQGPAWRRDPTGHGPATY